MTINETLLADGWKQYPDPFRDPKKILFAKKFAGHAECACNFGADKQCEIHYHSSERIANVTLPECWSVHMNGELPDGEWLRMRFESLTDLPTIYRCVDLLFLLWDEAVAKTPKIEKE